MNLSTDDNNYILFTSAAVGGKTVGGMQPVSQIIPETNGS